MKVYLSSKLTKNSIVAAAANSKALQTAIDKAASGACLMFPDGDFYFSSTINILNKSVKFQGAELTNLHFNCSGFILQAWPIQTCTINDLNIYYQGTRAGTSFNGIEARTVTNVNNVLIKNFGGYGLILTGDISTSQTNVSRSIITNVEAIECGHGFYTQGGDANGISFYSCDARDCDGYGFNDDGFLGCSFYSCMAHANKLGGYRAMNGNNRTLFMACYNEGGQPESEVGGVTYVFGGICGPGAGWKASGPNVKIIQQ